MIPERLSGYWQFDTDHDHGTYLIGKTKIQFLVLGRSAMNCATRRIEEGGVRN